MWRGLRFSKVVSYGNAADVDEVELLDYFAADPETEIIAGYIEGVKDGRRFLRALKEASLVKPVVIYKAGLTEAGERAARSHTASLSGSIQIFDALCRQAGAILVEDIDELTDVVVALRFAIPRPPNPGVAILGTGGGPSVQASDEIGRTGLEVPQLTPDVQAQLRRFLPLAGGMFTNPLDSTAFAADPAALAAAGGVLSSAANIGMILFHMGFHPATRWGQGRLSLPTLQAALEGLQKEMVTRSAKPLLVVLCQPRDLRGMEEFLRVQEMFVQARFPVFYSLGRVGRAMAQVIAWQRKRRC
jgi:acyl-CoA synthetase (NDP forming)